MKKTIFAVVAILTLTVPLAWAQPPENLQPDNQPQELVPGASSQTIPQNKETPRSGAAKDFVTPGRSPEKDCGSGDGGCHDTGKPQENLRAPEKKSCGTPSCT